MYLTGDQHQRKNSLVTFVLICIRRLRLNKIGIPSSDTHPPTKWSLRTQSRPSPGQTISLCVQRQEQDSPQIKFTSEVLISPTKQQQQYIFFRVDGTRQDRHFKVRDRSFYCRIDERTDIYAIFSGHNGSAVADYALQRIAAEIVLGQLYDKSTDDEIKDVLR